MAMKTVCGLESARPSAPSPETGAGVMLSGQHCDVPPPSTVEDLADGGLKSVENALRLLGCFVDKQEMGVSEIARRLGVAKSTTHRLLTTLSAQRYIVQNPDTGRYRLGLRLYELGQLAHDRLDLHQKALPVLEQLRQLTGCTVHLAIPDGPDIIYLERMHSLDTIQMFTDVQRRLPAHSTSSGKIISAFNDATAEARREAGFPQLTEQTIRSVKQFDVAIAESRVRRIAINRNEAQNGVTAVAAPILDRRGRARAAISIVGRTEDLAGELGKSARIVTAAAQRISRLVCL